MNKANICLSTLQYVLARIYNISYSAMSFCWEIYIQLVNIFWAFLKPLHKNHSLTKIVVFEKKNLKVIFCHVYELFDFLWSKYSEIIQNAHSNLYQII